MYDFSKMTNRFNTNSYKWDVKENELPMWVADMDFETAPAIIDALHNRVDHKIFGYNTVPDDYFEAYQNWWERRHHFHMEKDWMMFVTGVVPAISSVVRKVTTVGENVLIMSPVYNIFYNSILNNGRHVLSSDLVFDGKEYHRSGARRSRLPDIRDLTSLPIRIRAGSSGPKLRSRSSRPGKWSAA